VEQALVRANLDLPGCLAGDFGNLALSKDGTRIAYVTRGEDGKNQLATRLLAESEPKILAGTEGAVGPFFSPDGQWIGFGADGQVKKVLALGGAPLKLADAPVFFGGSWSPGVNGGDGFIVATVNAGTSLMRIPEAGGAAEALLPLGPGRVLVPQVLPGGNKVIFGGSGAQGPEVRILNRDEKGLDADSRRAVRAISSHKRRHKRRFQRRDRTHRLSQREHADGGTLRSGGGRVAGSGDSGAGRYPGAGWVFLDGGRAVYDRRGVPDQRLAPAVAAGGWKAWWNTRWKNGTSARNAGKLLLSSYLAGR
jgi:hypothetical protein